ncbi:TRAP transporter small permease [Treponema phagedenis]|uniref:TRAP transporter small permease n=1 Tax=Treponema phagedenis TaxID=162 RepID=A0A0B7GXR6_TREPH|nr:TRAP transporter small permease subunit [Treponema phagedenis]EFW38878.1 TRAP transporter, DctQ-like membrane protein [Treponema phagedenis F0421]NVP23913.1 TRAP transporter small permease [Treponema phagedenis]QEJ93826.1 TRAP transporter small permease [Treponema phagedenis]QEJ96584.1 TRAP transporter small permease [Treponema phagedenis]QEJ99751.1 TRAP transporter small permease [Treponema phagedenis]
MVKKAIIKILETTCVVIFIGITLAGLYQVFTRYFLTKPKSWSEEVLSFGFTWMAILGAALIFAKRDHMRLTFIIDKFGKRNRKIVELAVELFNILFAGLVMVYGGIRICTLTIKQTTPALQVSTGFIYSVIPIAGILIIIVSLINMKEILDGQHLESAEEVM